jgi:hypothetical protein
LPRPALLDAAQSRHAAGTAIAKIEAPQHEGTLMSDDLGNRGGQDRTRIDVNQDYELRDWSKKFGVTPQQLKEAVQAVGNRAADVEQRLKGSGKDRDGSR